MPAGLFRDGQSSGDVEVVEERQRDLVLGELAVAGRGAVAPQVLQFAGRPFESGLVELPGFGPAPREDQQPQRAGRETVEYVVDIDEVARGLRHLVALDEHAADVHPCPSEGSNAGVGLGLGAS